MTDKVFKPMRSTAPDPKYPVQFPKLGSPKLDGIRCCIYKGKALTKSGKPVPNVYIRNWLEANVPEGFDGELISGLPTLETCYGTTFSAVMRFDGEPDFTFYAFDLCDKLDMPALERKKNVKEACKSLPSQVVFVEQTAIEDANQLQRLYDYFIAMGYEGLMLVDPAGLYKYGRATAKSQEQLKYKPENDFEGEIVQTHEALANENETYTNDVGETQRSQHAENKVGKGMVGSYTVRDVLTGMLFKISAGKLTHDERTAEWLAYLADKSHRFGTYLKYRAMGYGTMTNGAARHGRWIGWRDIADMNPEEVRGDK